MEYGERRVVVSGFEAFGEDAINPTAEAMHGFQRDTERAARLAFMVLPVTFGGAIAVLHARLREERARGCLMFGLAARRTSIEVEASAFHASGEALHPRPVDVDRVMAALGRVGAPCAVSNDPGRFVCNATYHHTLAVFGARIPVLFVHVPATVALGGTVTQDVLSTWMAAAIDAFIDEVEKGEGRKRLRPRDQWMTNG